MRTTEKHKTASINSAQAPDQGFDARVAELWDAKLIPYATAKAGNFVDVRSALEVNLDAAGTKYGHKEKEGSSPWTVLVNVEGKIVGANTETRAGYIDVDADSDGKADLRVQIGPVFRGTAIRDSLDFVNFNEFTNQIDFAQFGKAFNTYLDRTVTSQLTRGGVVGKTLKALVAFPAAKTGELPLATPIKLQMTAP